jgi:hypothetical protein
MQSERTTDAHAPKTKSQAQTSAETDGFFPSAKSSFLPSSLRGKTSFLLEETVSSFSSLFPHLLICHVSIFV